MGYDIDHLSTTMFKQHSSIGLYTILDEGHLYTAWGGHIFGPRQ